MLRLEDLTAGTSVTGVVPGGPAELIAVTPIGVDTVQVVYRTAAGQLGEQILMRGNEPALDLVVAARTPFDRSTDADGHLVHIEVKGREPGAVDFFVTNREIRVGQNAGDYRLALVEVDPDRPAGDEQVRYVHRPFADEKVSALVSRVQFKWTDMWQRGGPPS